MSLLPIFIIAIKLYTFVYQEIVATDDSPYRHVTDVTSIMSPAVDTFHLSLMTCTVLPFSWISRRYARTKVNGRLCHDQITVRITFLTFSIEKIHHCHAIDQFIHSLLICSYCALLSCGRYISIVRCSLPLRIRSTFYPCEEYAPIIHWSLL